MTEVLLLLLAFCIVALIFLLLRPRDEAPELELSLEEKEWRTPGFLWPLVAGFLATIGVSAATPLSLWIAVPMGLLAAICVRLIMVSLLTRRAAKLELELADGIDLMVSNLRSGGSLSNSILGTAEESGPGLRAVLQELVERIQVGESPLDVLANLERRLPLESFRLFFFTLGAHWEGGGSIATTLSGVGASIRDRVEVSRQVKAQAIETQASVVGVLVVTYGLAALMYAGYPERVDLFLASGLGSMLVGFSVFLQAIGLVWVSLMSRIDV